MSRVHRTLTQKQTNLFKTRKNKGDNVRTLKFIVDQQTLKKDPSCDFSGLIKGTKGYLKAQIVFSKDWDGCVKVVGFSNDSGTEYPPQKLDNNNSCYISEEALKKQSFNIQVFGKKEGFFILTNKVKIIQDGGRI